MKPNESEDSVGTMAESLDGGEAASWGPTAPDGGPLPGLVNTVIPKAKPWDRKNSPCLRDCRHYFTATVHFEHGNYEGGLGAFEPVQDRHVCKAIPGVFLELSGDAPVYECSDWHPQVPENLEDRERLRERYYAEHPEDVPDSEQDAQDEPVEIDIEDDQEDETNE
jgi:hypothetical protein